MKTQSRRRISYLAVASLAGLSIFAGSSHLAAADKAAAEPKYNVSDVMKKVFKGKEKSVFAAVSSGHGTAEQKKLTVEYLEALAVSKAPKGDQKDWDKRTADMLTAAKALNSGDAKAAGALKQAANCKGCHDLHKE
jgi:hypothetical protein